MIMNTFDRWMLDPRSQISKSLAKSHASHDIEAQEHGQFCHVDRLSQITFDV